VLSLATVPIEETLPSRLLVVLRQRSHWLSNFWPECPQVALRGDKRSRYKDPREADRVGNNGSGWDPENKG